MFYSFKNRNHFGVLGIFLISAINNYISKIRFVIYDKNYFNRNTDFGKVIIIDDWAIFKLLSR